MPEQSAFGHRLRELRIERGFSQSALAGDGMSTGYLSRLESGARPPTERAMAYLAQRLGVCVSAFGTPSRASLAQVLALATSSALPDQAIGPLRETLETEAQSDPALRWQARFLVTTALARAGRQDEALVHARELTTLGDELTLPELRVRARIQLTRCLRHQGDNGEARERAAEAVRIARSHQLHPTDLAAALLVLIAAEAEAGFLLEARAHADDLCALAEQASEKIRAEAQWAAAMVRMREGDYAGARHCIERAMEQLDSRTDVVLWMRLRLAAASLHLQAAVPNTAAARSCLAEAETPLTLVGTDQHRQELLLLQARLAFQEDRTAEAERLCRRIGELPGRLSFRDRVRLDVLRSRLLILGGETEAGVRRLRELAEEAREALNVHLSAEIWRDLAEQLAPRGTAQGTPSSQGR